MKSCFLGSWIILAALLMLATPSAFPSDSSAPQSAQVIDVKAKKYEFDPSPIRVKQGAKVQLKITAVDHVHGFRMSAIPDNGGGTDGLAFSTGQGCNRIEKGQTATVEFIAQKPGTYSFKCCVHCGWHHRSMHGELIVEP